MTNYDDSVWGFPLPDWEEFEEKFSRIKSAGKRVRDFRRLIIGGAEEVSLDNQGRIRVSQSLCEYGGLSQEVVLLGQGKRFEIWNPDRYQAVVSQNFDDVTEELADSGIDFVI